MCATSYERYLLFQFLRERLINMEFKLMNTFLIEFLFNNYILSLVSNKNWTR